jgi:hypothetical protein
MKIGKYIFEILPKDAKEIILDIPATNLIIYYSEKENIKTFKLIKTNMTRIIKSNYIRCKHLKPGTGERYEILGLYWKILIIKIIN